MKSPSVTVTLVPAINVLAASLTQTSENYQQLLNDPEAYAFCSEAGRSLRKLSKRYAKVLSAALIYQTNDNDEDDKSSEADLD